MKINVAQIRKSIGARQSYYFLIPIKSLIPDDTCWMDGEIEIRGEIVNAGKGLVAEGVLSGTAGLKCHRCLKEFERLIEIPYEETYQEADAGDRDCSDAALFSGDEIDLTDLIIESIVLAEPIKTICSEDCQGLCPKCGTDLNVFQCSCEKGTIDPRLAALQKFLNDR